LKFILNMSTKKPGDTATATEEEPEGENDWFFDIIINFLRSPRWKTPIMSFLDEYSLYSTMRMRTSSSTHLST